MDLIAKLDLEKAQLQRGQGSSPTSIAAKTLSPGKALYKAFGQDRDSITVAELQSQLEQEKAQRQQVWDWTKYTSEACCLSCYDKTIKVMP